MDHDHDFPALRNLLALKKLEMPLDTEVNRFVIEFHRRQRAQLLVPQSRWARVVAWVKERTEGLNVLPPVSYASGFAAIALVAFLGFSQQVQVTRVDGQDKLSLRMPNSNVSFAMLPASLTGGAVLAPATSNSLTFTPAATRPAATRFILANTRVAYDATVAF